MMMSFGKHQGKELSDIPHGYLAWLVRELEDEIDKKQKLLDAVEEELSTG